MSYLARASRFATLSGFERCGELAVGRSAEMQRAGSTPAGKGGARKDRQEQEVNVQVLLRCRPAEPEEAAKQPQIVNCSEYNREVSVSQTASSRPIARTYHFDRVFGPECGQDAIYRHAVTGIVEEVLEGFNCCIFAYGQTGTGKTYTMQGETDSRPDSSQCMPDDAGVIPRAVDHIFRALEAAGAEYSIKCTFLELYNEEITDLLSKEDITNPNERKRLQLMEDQKGQVLVRGLEEVTVTNSDEIFKVLEDGTARRKTAETMLNKQSSRSHSVFSITIHIKEPTVDGEELIKCGKLNLVDLAGSENISRSGSNQKDSRTREAGEINKSLLTLGRVITALVERGNHVPYRDSKLTRLLRDALGGRSKTCIIATVAPTLQHLDETLSTLDYAHRAKNIRNKPELNQKMTKAAHIKELTQEIERLKNELDAMREEKGVYLPQEKYNAEMQEKSRLQSRCEEIEAEIETYKQQYEEMVHKFEEQSKKIESEENARREADDKLQRTYDALHATRSELERHMQHHSQTMQQTHAHTLCGKGTGEEDTATLPERASSLKSSLQQSVSAVQSMYDSMHAMTDAENCEPEEVRSLNSNVASKIGKIETAFLNAIDEHKVYHQRIAHNVDRLLSELQSTQSQQSDDASEIVEKTHHNAQSASESASAMAEEVSAIWQSTLCASEQKKADALSKLKSMRESSVENIGNSLVSNSTAKQQLMQMVEQQREASNELVRSAEEIASSARQSLEKLANSASHMAQQVQDGREESVGALHQMQSDVRNVQRAGKEELMQQISSLLDSHMQKAYDTLRAGAQSAETAVDTSTQQLKSDAIAMQEQAGSGSAALSVPVTGTKRQAETSIAALDESSKKASTLLESSHSSAEEASSCLRENEPSISSVVDQMYTELGEHARSAQKKQEERKQSVHHALQKVQNDATSTINTMERNLTERYKAMEERITTMSRANEQNAANVQYSAREGGDHRGAQQQRGNGEEDSIEEQENVENLGLRVNVGDASTAGGVAEAAAAPAGKNNQSGGSTPKEATPPRSALQERGPNTQASDEGSGGE